MQGKNLIIVKHIILSLSIFTIMCPAFSQDTEAGTLLEINGTALFVKVTGKGEPLLVIHGGPVLDYAYLAPHFKELENEFMVIYFDQRASGRSSAQVDTAAMSMDMLTKDVLGILNHLNIPKSHIMGHSWGGLIAMEFAVNYPERTQSLALLNSIPPSTALWQEEQMAGATEFSKADSLARAEIILSDAFKNYSPEAIRKLLMLSFKYQFHDPDNSEKLTLYVPDDYMTRNRIFSHLGPYLMSYDLSEKLTTMEIPTLLVYGADEKSVEIGGAYLNRIIPDAQWIVIPDAGHFPFIEQSELFNEAVMTFLRKSEINRK